MARPTRVGLLPVALVLLAGACSDDGRELPPPRPDQDLSITTMPTSTTSTTSATSATSATAGTGASIGSATTAARSEPLLITPWSETVVIDPKYTCQGPDLSPPLAWTLLPAGTLELAVVVTDLDAGNFVHWVIAGIDAGGPPFLTEGVAPAGAVQAVNDFGRPGWGGPCPPAGERHTYATTLYALDRPSGVIDGQPPRAAIAAIAATRAARVTVTGEFGG